MPLDNGIVERLHVREHGYWAAEAHDGWAGGGLVVAAAELAEADVIDDELFRASPAAHPGFVGLIREPDAALGSTIGASWSASSAGFDSVASTN